MSAVQMTRGRLGLAGTDSGAGYPVIFQHGLGGDEAQAAEVFPDNTGFRRLTLDCRGQGRSPLGEPQLLSIATFADDVLAFADHCGVQRFAVGGISMGAAIALRIGVRAPNRVTALVLGRPAWLWSKAPPNMQVFAEVAALLRGSDPQTALAAFEASESARTLAMSAPDNLASLRRFFEWPDPKATAELLAAIATDGPGIAQEDVHALKCPVLVIGNGLDAIHPLSMARTLATAIPGAHYIEIAPKATDRPRHAAEFRAAVAAFLNDIPSVKGRP